MVAERHDRRYRPGKTEPGSGSWFRPLTWISDPTQRHRGAVLIPFKEATLERGRAAFENEGLITVAKSRYDPVTRQRFQSGHPEPLHQQVRHPDPGRQDPSR
jgi:hypothetical protein